jgi:hypothetical protein
VWSSLRHSNESWLEKVCSTAIKWTKLEDENIYNLFESVDDNYLLHYEDSNIKFCLEPYSLTLRFVTETCHGYKATIKAS